MRGVKRVRSRAGRWLFDTLSRIRHFRGHGVHSPYIYNIVRRVFMRKSPIEGANHDLYDQLKESVGVRIAIDLQNLASVCGYTNYRLNPETTEPECDLVILQSLQLTKIEQSIESGATIAIIYDSVDKELERWEREMWLNHRSTIVKRRRYLLIFNNHLPKQRFVL